MWLCKDAGLDWTAIAALIALSIWVADGLRRSRERAAARRLLAQIMTAPVGAAQIDIARFRTAVIPTNGDTTTLLNLLGSQELRRAFASKAFEVRLDLPSQDRKPVGLGAIASEPTPQRLENRLRCPGWR
jgi:hypothetical protein